MIKIAFDALLVVFHFQVSSLPIVNINWKTIAQKVYKDHSSTASKACVFLIGYYDNYNGAIKRGKMYVQKS